MQKREKIEKGLPPVFIVLKKKKKTTATGVLAELVRVNPYTLNDCFNSKGAFLLSLHRDTKKEESLPKHKKYVSVTDANLLERYRLYLNKRKNL